MVENRRDNKTLNRIHLIHFATVLAEFDALRGIDVEVPVHLIVKTLL